MHILKNWRQTIAVSSLLLFSAMGVSAQTTITGAGATFPYPVFAKWAAQYRQETGQAVNYQSIGSGGGIKQILAKTVDFGASDRPMTPAELRKNGLTQFPSVMGGVVPVYNVKGVPASGLRLDAATLSAIFRGEIKNWNDPRIAALNPTIKLPKQAITVVHRSDGSGTTFLFTNYLTNADSKWKTQVGEGTAVRWPTGVGGKGNEGVAAYIAKLNGAIGYVEYAYAKQNKLSMITLKNREGQFVAPSDAAFKAAVVNAQWNKAPEFYLVLNNQPGAQSWPIVGATFILMHKTPADPARTKKALSFFEWAYKKGGAMATSLGYVPIPDTVYQQIFASWKQTFRDASGKAVY